MSLLSLRSECERISKGKLRVNELIKLTNRSHAVMTRLKNNHPEQFEITVLGAVIKKES